MHEVSVTSPHERRSKYRPPAAEDVACVQVTKLIEGVRTIEAKQQARLPGVEEGVFCVGDISLVKQKCIAIVGSRKVSEDGAKRARKLARQLAERGVVVISGLAEGVDENAHRAAIEAGGRSIAVIGTPIDKAYPAKHAELQERIYRDHLLVSPFPIGGQVFPSNFPERNKLMAALADGSVIIEASDKSGSLHQAAECKRIGRWLFILRSVVDNPAVTWPQKFIGGSRVRVVETVDDILGVI